MVVSQNSDQEVAHAGREPPQRRWTGVDLALALLGIGPLLILFLLVVVIGLVTPNFLKPVNLGNILSQTAVIAIVAMGQQLVILTRGIDLSVGSNLALATVIGGLTYQQIDSAPLVMLAMLVSGGLSAPSTAPSSSMAGCRTRSSSRWRP